MISWISFPWMALCVFTCHDKKWDVVDPKLFQFNDYSCCSCIIWIASIYHPAEHNTPQPTLSSHDLHINHSVNDEITQHECSAPTHHGRPCNFQQRESKTSPYHWDNKTNGKSYLHPFFCPCHQVIPEARQPRHPDSIGIVLVPVTPREGSLVLTFTAKPTTPHRKVLHSNNARSDSKNIIFPTSIPFLPPLLTSFLLISSLFHHSNICT